MSGRPAKPIELHRLQGTAQPCRIEARARELTVPAESVGDPPDWFADHPMAREEWLALATHPQYSQVLNPIHRSLLIEYCLLHETMILAAQGKGTMSATQRQSLGSLRMQLGITPASQAKVK